MAEPLYEPPHPERQNDLVQSLSQHQVDDLIAKLRRARAQQRATAENA